MSSAQPLTKRRFTDVKGVVTRGVTFFARRAGDTADTPGLNRSGRVFSSLTAHEDEDTWGGGGTNGCER